MPARLAAHRRNPVRWHTSGVQYLVPDFHPVVSLVPRSTTGYRLPSRRDGKGSARVCAGIIIPTSNLNPFRTEPIILTLGVIKIYEYI